MPVGSGRKRRLRREKAAARRAAEEASAQPQAAVTAAAAARPGATDAQDRKFVMVKRARTSGPYYGEEQAAAVAEAPQRDSSEDWITGGDAKQRQREQRAERKRKAREEKGREGVGSSDAAAGGTEGVDINTVFVGGIPFSTTQEEVRQFFATHGCAGVADVRIPMKDKDGYAKGFCHVTFESVEAAQAAVGCDGQYLGERWLQIKLAARPSGSHTNGRSSTIRTAQPAGCKTLFARNIAYSADEKLLSKHFAAAGTVPIEVRIPRDFHTERPKGYAYIQLADEEDAAKAMAALEATELLGRPIFLDWEDRKQFVANYERPLSPRA